MKPRVFAFTIVLVCLSMLAALLSGSVMPTTAQQQIPSTPSWVTQPPSPDGAPWKTTDKGRRYMSADMQSYTRKLTPQSTGGPDDFGYTWDDSAPLGWIDAVTGGTDTGLSGYAWDLGPVQASLPFPFKYYENTYTNVYIQAAGFVSFSSDWSSWQDGIPNPASPNDVIAPYWLQDIYLKSAGPDARVYYRSGGTAPNRYFVVEWNNVKGGDPSDLIGGDDTFRFEVVLYENGDFDFKYQAMTYSGGNWYCGTGAGIEDSRGLDGLMYLDSCTQAPSNKAVHFTRPAPTARVGVTPLYYSQFTHANQTVAVQVSIRNTGELGTDTYDLLTSSTWLVSFYAADGTTPLSDTDGDSIIDTGPVVQGGSTVIIVKVPTPSVASGGDTNMVYLTVRSSLNTSKSKTPILQSAVPTTFAQVFRDNANGAMSLYLAQPAGQLLTKATEDNHWGYNMAVAEMPSGNFIYTWSAYRWLGNVGVESIEYTLLNRYGETVRPVSQLTNNSGATVYAYDYPAVAVAPNGHIGVLFYRYLYDNTDDQSNYNIYFAVLDASGSLISGPVNLTNNALWGTYSTLNVPQFYDQHITATADNRFILAWGKYYYGTPTGNCTSYCLVNDIYYAVRDSNGNQVKAPAAFTHDTAGYDDGYSGPTLTQVSGDRALLAFSRHGSYGDIYYAVLDSSGSTVKGMTNLSSDGAAQYDYSPDAVQLSNGKVTVAWTTSTSGLYPSSHIRFAVLDTMYNRIVGPNMLNNPATVIGDDCVSVAADAAGRAVLTWIDYAYGSRRNLYYALVNGDGAQVTSPLIFHTSQANYSYMKTSEPANGGSLRAVGGGGGGGTAYIETSCEGYGNTSYSWTPPTDVDEVVTLGSPLVGSAPGGIADIGVNYANHGAAIATNIVLTATLDSHLTYSSDTSGIVPAIIGNKVIWNLPDMALYDGGQFMLRVNVPFAAIGTRYPVTFTLASAGPEANSTDNMANAEVMVAYQVYLPLIAR